MGYRCKVMTRNADGSVGGYVFNFYQGYSQDVFTRIRHLLEVHEAPEQVLESLEMHEERGDDS